jgi:hypothetical protein
VQTADLVAWTAYQHLLRHPGKRFAWHWYDRHLRSSDANGGPVLLRQARTKLDPPIHMCGAGPHG